MSIDACPTESTKRSLSAHPGSAGLCLRCCVQSRYPIGASAMGVPGWPELAFSTASMASTLDRVDTETVELG